MPPTRFTSRYWEYGHQLRLLRMLRDKHVQLIKMLRDKQRSLRIREDGYQFDLLDVKVLADSDFK